MKHLDQRVLDCLKQDARMSLEDMAMLCQDTPQNVATSIQSLTDTKVLLKCVPVIDETKLLAHDMPIQALVELNISPQKSTGYNTIGDRISRFPNVKAQYLLSGQYDFLVLIEARNHQEIATFVYEKLATLEGVNGTNTHFILKRYKEAGVLLKEEESIQRQVISA